MQGGIDVNTRLGCLWRLGLDRRSFVGSGTGRIARGQDGRGMRRVRSWHSRGNRRRRRWRGFAVGRRLEGLLLLLEYRVVA